MDKYVLRVSETARWHALLSKAEVSAGYVLDDQIETYLVYLLVRFVGRAGKPGSKENSMGMKNLLDTRSLRHDDLQEIGDQCLLYAGLFPDYAEEQFGPISHFVELGRKAYKQLAVGKDNTIYLRLGDSFVFLMDILQNMRELDDGFPCLDLMQAHELWNRTGSRHAWRILAASTQATPITDATNNIH